MARRLDSDGEGVGKDLTQLAYVSNRPAIAAYDNLRAGFSIMDVDCVVIPIRTYRGDPSKILGFMEIHGQRFLILSSDAESSRDCVGAPQESSYNATQRSDSLAEILTDRELQVAGLVAAGRCNKEIARQLGLSVWTVATHIRRIFSKLDLHSRTALAAQLVLELREAPVDGEGD